MVLKRLAVTRTAFTIPLAVRLLPKRVMMVLFFGPTYLRAKRYWV